MERGSSVIFSMPCVRRVACSKEMEYIVPPPRFHRVSKFLPPIFVQFTSFCLICVCFPSPVLTIMHLCIMLYAYWTPLLAPALLFYTCFRLALPECGQVWGHGQIV